MANEIATLDQATKEQIEQIVDWVLAGETNKSTRRNYARGIRDFIVWYQLSGQVAFSKQTVEQYKEGLKKDGMGERSINQRLTAIRKMARELVDNGRLPEAIAQGIQRVKGIKLKGKKIGAWLTLEQAQALLFLPDTRTVQGLRDRALFGVFLGCGLRRSEIVGLTVDQLQKREGRWVFVDIEGKHNRVRSVPVPNWVKLAIDQYMRAGKIESELIFRSIHRKQANAESIDLSGRGGMGGQAIYYIMAKYAEELAERYAEDKLPVIKPHDLRYSFAKLAKQAGGDIVQIQKTLGHASVKTTEDYIGEDQDLKQAPGDLIDLHLL